MSPKHSALDLAEKGENIENSEDKKQWIEYISLKPKAAIYHNFLTEKECQHLINLTKSRLQRSRVQSLTSSQGDISSTRTSSGADIYGEEDEIVSKIESRIAKITSTPIENGEPFEVLKYEVGQKFVAHYDYDDNYPTIGGPRKATFLIYLSNVEEGGETVFTQGRRKGSKKGEVGISIKPKMGDALLFLSMKADGTRDPASLHCGSPVLKGTKWLCTKWLHVNEYA